MKKRSNEKKFTAPFAHNKRIELETGHVEGFHVDLGTAPLIVIKARRGYVMCGYLNMDTANRLGDIAGKVSKVNSYDDVLNAELTEVSEKAREMGLKKGITGREFLNMVQ